MTKKNKSFSSLPPSSEVEEAALEKAQQLAKGLFPHQVEGLAFLLARRRAILADDMGLGKTRQAIAAVTHLEPEGPYLVVCPAAVKINWEREVHAYIADAPTLVVSGSDSVDAQLGSWPGWVIINYDILKQHIGALRAIPWKAIIFDEAHYLKNHTSQRSKLARQLRPQFSWKGRSSRTTLSASAITSRLWRLRPHRTRHS
jgi:SWI/SNF-related matrix-associated actin-dependent regulator 1 of chromatin subfamily A